jgi:Xaa-Pro aminopeptidase
MLTMHSMLLVGPYDWDPAVLPKAEFAERLAAYWKRAPAGCAGLVVYGDSRAHAEMAYFTGFVPKVRNALALVPRQGEPVMLVPGTRAGLAAASRLTWTPRVELLSDAAKAIAEWKSSLGAGAALALIGGENARPPIRQTLLAATGREEETAEDKAAAAALGQVMLRKRPREVDAMRGACAMVDAARAALQSAQQSGAGITRAVLEAEHAAHRKGAQDVRTLFSIDRGRTLVPFADAAERNVDPLQLYFAARNNGYWADGMLFASSTPHAAWTQAAKALEALLAACRPGARARELSQKVDAALKPFARHAVTANEFGNAVGLSLESGPVLTATGDETLEEGGVYSLRVGATGDDQHALVSALVLVRAGEPEVLWSSLQQGRQ